MLSKNELYRRGTAIYAEQPDGQCTYVCMECSTIFIPRLQECGKLPKGYWVCPNGCNKGASRWTKDEKYLLPED